MKTRTAELTIGKHWINYLIPVTLTLIGLSMISASSFIKYIGYVLIVHNGIRIYSLSTVKWLLTESELHITTGMLPWTKNVWQIPILDIYESSVSFGMFGHFLGYGNIKIRRTEGVTSEIYGSALRGAKGLSAQINELVQEFKKSKHSTGVNQVAINKSISDELKDLAELKSKGELTQQEFDILKQKYLNEI